MIILNPGTPHFNSSTGAAILEMSDYKNAATAVDSISNNPSVLS